jgi:hypothetical protein
MDAQEVMKKLQEPFPPEDIEWRVGATNKDKTKGIALAYVTNRAIMNRLDTIFGPFGWRNEFREWKNNSQLCGISVNWNGEWITKWDGADDSQTEAVKGGLSDAMKRAGYQWGIGRYLYNLENVWMPIENGRLTSEPRLPAWALPEGYQYNSPNKGTQEPTNQSKQDIPPATLKAKYQVYFGSLDGFEEWVTEQQKAGKNYRAMEHGLQDDIKKREGGTTVKNGLNAKSRVINMMSQMKWTWSDLGSFASDVLKRDIHKVISDIKTEAEWKQVEDAMIITKQNLA